MNDDDLSETGHLRVSDHERQAVVDRLSRATGDGMLTLDEFADHAAAAYAAITRADLEAATADLRLPVLVPPPAPAPARVAEPTPHADALSGGETEVLPKRKWMIAIMGGEDRRGRWRANRRMGAFALMGGVDIDLRDALLEGPEIEITAWAIMGGVNVIVPEGIYVETSGFVLMGGRSNRVKDVEPVQGAPVIRVKGYGLWGGVDVRSKPSTAEEAAKRAARRGERHTRQAERRTHRPHMPPIPPIPPIPPMHSFPAPPIPPILMPPPLLGAAPAPPADPAPSAAPAERVERADEGPVHHVTQGGLLTVVCTDIVGSTRLADQLGDQRWRGVLQAHNTLVREQVNRHGGTEVKTSGDGFLLTFTSARRAVRFGVDVQEALAAYRDGHPDTPLEIRIGVHAGDVERDGNDVVGRNVSLASRLCNAASPGEVLASAVVVDLADSASDIGFGDARELRLAGIDRAVRAHPALGSLTTAAVVLAAGGGTRFSGPTHKLLAPLRGRAVVEHAVDAARAAGLDEVVVVTGAIEVPAFAGVTVVPNAAWSDGIATSVQAALVAAREGGHAAVVIGLGDQPFVVADAWRLVAAATATAIAVATYDGVRGNPVRLAAEVWDRLPTTGDKGARSLLRREPALVTEVPCPGSGADIDTLEDLRTWS